MATANFLESSNGQPMTKVFSIDNGGDLIKSSYPMVKNFTSHEEQFNTIEELHAAIMRHAATNHCLLKGQLDRPLVNESRAGHTNSELSTEWIVLDNDNLHDMSPREMLELTGIGDVDHIVQYSASSGVVPGHNGYHLFLLLDREYTPKELKLWLKDKNLTTPQISQHIKLAASNVALKWPLDISVCQNDKLIYIAPPICGEDVVDSRAGNRIELVKGSHRTANLEG